MSRVWERGEIHSMTFCYLCISCENSVSNVRVWIKEEQLLKSLSSPIRELGLRAGILKEAAGYLFIINNTTQHSEIFALQ